MRISEVAARSGVPATTLRYYDSIGLLRAHRSSNGYRSYEPAVLDHLALIDAAKQLDLPLPEIAELLDVVDGDSCTRVRDALHPRLLNRLREVDARLVALTRLREGLVAASESVAACPDSGRSCRSECMIQTNAGTGCTPASHVQPGAA